MADSKTELLIEKKDTGLQFVIIDLPPFLNI